MSEKTGATYFPIHKEERVRVKVPKEGEYMVPVGGHQFENEGKIIDVPDHWRSSAVLRSIILQRNFFGVGESDLGKKITATVEVIEKRSSRGKRVLLINISRTENFPVCQMLIKTNPGSGYPLVAFERIKKGREVMKKVGAQEAAAEV